MKLLLDSHVFLWWLQGGEGLRPEARKAIAQNDEGVWVSAASVWELGLKAHMGKLKLPGSLSEAITQSAFKHLSITSAHAECAANLPLHHRDPFDRMLVGQAQSEGMTLVSRDDALEAYGVAILKA